jgi:hypothetical protein
LHLQTIYTLKMEANGSAEKLVSVYNTTLSHISEDHNRHIHCRENLKYYTCPTVYYSFYVVLLALGPTQPPLTPTRGEVKNHGAISPIRLHGVVLN